MSERIVPVSINDTHTLASTKPISQQVSCKLRCKGCTVEIYNGIQSRVLDTLLKAILNYG